MGWKHFWLRNPVTRTDGYCVNSYGALNKLTFKKYKNIWLKYNEIMEILNLKTKQERYSLCDKLFKEKFPQSKNKQIELLKEEQSKLEKLFT